MKLPWSSRTNTYNSFFFRHICCARISQQANKASCSGFRNCKLIPQKNKWNPQFCQRNPQKRRIPQIVCGFRILFITEFAHEQLKARAGILIYSDAELDGTDLTNVSGINQQISKHLSTKPMDVTF